MKRLVQLFPPVLAILNDPSRPRLPSRYASRPPCFIKIWRDCGSGSVYYEFHDGTIYRYFPPALDDVRALLRAGVLGKFFNFNVRRPVPFNQFFRFWGPPPGTATLIYSYPPYAATDPGNCIPWNFPGTHWGLTQGLGSDTLMPVGTHWLEQITYTTAGGMPPSPSNWGVNFSSIPSGVRNIHVIATFNAVQPSGGDPKFLVSPWPGGTLTIAYSVYGAGPTRFDATLSSPGSIGFTFNCGPGPASPGVVTFEYWAD